MRGKLFLPVGDGVGKGDEERDVGVTVGTDVGITVGTDGDDRVGTNDGVTVGTDVARGPTPV